MKNKKNRIFQKICLAIGICMLVGAMAVLVLWQWGIHNSKQQAEYYVNTIRTSTPKAQGASLEERKDNTMPVLSVDGTDFVGIIEMPRFDSNLPVCAKWGEISKYPCCFTGSVYDRTIKIGGTSQKGHYDFYREISVGDSVLFTDMEGNRYSYEVTDITYEKHADQTTLNYNNSSLTLFIKNEYAFEYIIISCDELT